MCFSLYCCHCVLLQVTKVTKVVVMNCAEIEIQSAKCSPGDFSESSLWGSLDLEGSLQYEQNAIICSPIVQSCRQACVGTV